MSLSFIQSVSCWCTFDYFQSFVITNSSVVNKFVCTYYICLPTALVEQLPGDRISGSKGQQICNFDDSCQIVLCRGCTILRCHQQCTRVLISPPPCQQSGVKLLDFCQSDRWRKLFHYIFTLSLIWMKLSLFPCLYIDIHLSLPICICIYMWQLFVFLFFYKQSIL